MTPSLWHYQNEREGDDIHRTETDTQRLVQQGGFSELWYHGSDRGNAAQPRRKEKENLGPFSFPTVSTCAATKNQTVPIPANDKNGN